LHRIPIFSNTLIFLLKKKKKIDHITQAKSDRDPYDIISESETNATLKPSSGKKDHEKITKSNPQSLSTTSSIITKRKKHIEKKKIINDTKLISQPSLQDVELAIKPTDYESSPQEELLSEENPKNSLIFLEEQKPCSIGNKSNNKDSKPEDLSLDDQAEKIQIRYDDIKVLQNFLIYTKKICTSSLKETECISSNYPLGDNHPKDISDLSADIKIKKKRRLFDKTIQIHDPQEPSPEEVYCYGVLISMINLLTPFLS
jgi:hypothetical protein